MCFQDYQPTMLATIVNSGAQERGGSGKVPDDSDFPFVDVGVIDETRRIPGLRFLLDFLELVGLQGRRGTRSCRLKRVSEALVAMFSRKEDCERKRQ